MSLACETKNNFKMPNIKSLKPDHVPKYVICACAEAKDGCGFELKMFLKQLGIMKIL